MYMAWAVSAQRGDNQDIETASKRWNEQEMRWIGKDRGGEDGQTLVSTLYRGMLLGSVLMSWVVMGKIVMRRSG
jgi:hypothetical protein